MRVGYGIKRPDKCGIVGCHKTQRAQTCFFHLVGQQQAKGLLCVAARKTVNHRLRAPVVGKTFDHQAVGGGKLTSFSLKVQPVAGRGGKLGPVLLLEHHQDALGELR